MELTKKSQNIRTVKNKMFGSVVVHDVVWSDGDVMQKQPTGYYIHKVDGGYSLFNLDGECIHTFSKKSYALMWVENNFNEKEVV